MILSKRIRRTLSMAITAAFVLFNQSIHAAGLPPADVMMLGGSVHVSAPITAQVNNMSISIVSDDGGTSISTQTDGSDFVWSPGPADADGSYRYEVTVAAGDEEAGTDEASRTFGEFTVSNGMVYAAQPEPENQVDDPVDQQGTWEAPGVVEQVAVYLLDMLVPEAAAADSTITDVSPQLNFVDTSPSTCGAFIQPSCPTDIQLEANSGSDFYMQEGTSSTFFRYYGSSNDIALLGSDFYFDTSPVRLGIGTTAPPEEISVVGADPTISLNDTAGVTWEINSNPNSTTFDIANITAGNSILGIASSAPANSVYIASAGVGIGTSSIGSQLEVAGDIRASFSGGNSGGDGLTKLVRMNANNTDLAKSSDVGFELSNAKLGFSWAFRTFEGPQGFAATKQGSGGSELTIENPTSDYTKVVLKLGSGATNTNGQWINASSRAYKDNIHELSAADAIKALEELTPVTYTFKNDASKDLNVGFIAEETPELISIPERNGLNPLEVVAMLTKVVKEQQKALQDQEQTMADYQQALQVQKEAMEKQQEMLDTLLRERTANVQTDAITTSMLVQ